MWNGKTPDNGRLTVTIREVSRDDIDRGARGVRLRGFRLSTAACMEVLKILVLVRCAVAEPSSTAIDLNGRH